MLCSVNLKDYMITQPLKTTADATLLEAIDLITRNQVSGLCVVDEQDTLIGILSELDCLRGILSASYDLATTGRVRDYMVSADINFSRASDDIIDVAADMLRRGQRRRPVLGENNRLIGLITCRQLLAAVRQLSAVKAAEHRS